MRIRREGPLSIAAFMAIALHDPEAGYYARRRQPIGRAGDFVTAPEISQIFGELIGLCCAEWWQRAAGRPDPVILAELGPGRGTLAEDFLRAVGTAAPDFRRAIRLYLIEASAALRAQQQRRLGHARPQFAADLGGLPQGALLVVANEFLDALPIRQLVRRGAGWAERLVALDVDENLVFAEGRASPVLSLLVPKTLRDRPEATVIEICPAAAALATTLGERLARQPGLALFIDYGHCPSAPGATLAAISGHGPADVLDDPGNADLSAHVDFAAFAECARSAGAAVHGPMPQARFLCSLGVEARLAALTARAATPAQRALLHGGVARLIDPAEMGTLFKVLALTSPGLPAPAGFA